MFYKIILTLLLTFICTSNLFAKKAVLIFYSGISIIKPMKEMAKIIEDKYNCIIMFSQSNSNDLYNSIRYSKEGDLFLPESTLYSKNSLSKDFITKSVEIGFNKAAIFVQKNNPRNISSLEDLVSENFASILSDPKAENIGEMTKHILISYKNENFFNLAYDNTVEIGTDPRNLNRALIEKRADITINWKATAHWPENSPYIDTIDIDENYAPKNKLILSTLSFSKNKKIAEAFMKFAISEQGKKIMKKHGFL